MNIPSFVVNVKVTNPTVQTTTNNANNHNLNIESHPQTARQTACLISQKPSSTRNSDRKEERLNCFSNKKAYKVGVHHKRVEEPDAKILMEKINLSADNFPDQNKSHSNNKHSDNEEIDCDDQNSESIIQSHYSEKGV